MNGHSITVIRLPLNLKRMMPSWTEIWLFWMLLGVKIPAVPAVNVDSCIVLYNKLSPRLILMIDFCIDFKLITIANVVFNPSAVARFYEAGWPCLFLIR